MCACVCVRALACTLRSPFHARPREQIDLHEINEAFAVVVLANAARLGLDLSKARKSWA